MKGFHDIGCEEFEIMFMTTLNNHAPMKIKYIRANNSPNFPKQLWSDLDKEISILESRNNRI